MPKRAAFRPSDLVIIEKATLEPIVPGDFVRLASGSPQGLVIAIANDVATVAWLADDCPRTQVSTACLRPNASRIV